MASSSLSASMVATTSSIASTLEVKGLKVSVGSFASKPMAQQPLAISNGSRVSCMLVWPPNDNPKFETLSYLPQLSEEQIAKQVNYITSQGFIPCLEFDRRGGVYRENFRGPGYYDGRYWTMWKLPMFGCTDSSAVLREIRECQKSYPDSYIRVLGFDNKRQVQVVSFLVQKPTTSA